MATEDLGTLQIGISADTSKLDAALQSAQQKVSSFKIKEKVLPITVLPPSDAAIQKAQRAVNTALQKAARLGVELSPTLTVKNVKIADFRNEIQRKLDQQKAIEVPVQISAEVNGQDLRDQILRELGIVDIPLTWHWAGEPPPGGAGPGGPGGGGGGGGGGVRPPTGSGPAAPPAGTTVTPPTGGGGKPAAPVIGVARPASTAASKPATGAASKPATGKPAGAKVSQPAGATVATPPVTPPGLANILAEGPEQKNVPVKGPPSAAPTIGAPKNPTFTTQTGPAKAGMSEAERIEARVADAVQKLTRGRPGGVEELLKMGAILTPENPDAGFTVKKNSQLFKYLEAHPEAEAGLDTAIAAYAQVAGREEFGRPAFEGAARALGNPTMPKPQSPMAIRWIRERIMMEAKARRAEFAGREDVQAFKALFKERGFAAFGDVDLMNPKGFSQDSILAEQTGGTIGIGSQLVRAHGRLAEDPAGAREEASEALTIFASLFPKEFGKLFPSKARGKTPSIGHSRQTKSGEGVDPALELVASAVQAIFGEAYRTTIPRRDVAEKEGRKSDREARGTKPATDVSPGAVAEATAKRAREDAAFKMAREKGLSRAKVPGPALPPEPIDFSVDKAFRDAEIERIRKEVHGKTIGQFGGEDRRPFASLELAGPEFHRRYPHDDFGLPEDQTFKYTEQIRKAFARYLKRRASGGPVLKPGGLMARLHAKGVPIPDNAVIVGEKGEEIFVPDQSGHIIDNQGQNLPEWLRRAQESAREGKKGLAKDLTRRAAGGPVRGFGGRAFRSFVPGEKEAIASGVLTRGDAPSVQRVFVVNWPSGFGRGTATSQPAAPIAAQPVEQGLKPKLKEARAKSAKPEAETTLTGRSLGGFTPLEEAKLEAARQDLITAQRLRQKQIAAQISAAIREAPTRGLQTATGEIAAINIGGLRGVIERRRLAEEASVRSTAALQSYAKAQERVEKTTIKLAEAQDPKKIQQLNQLLDQQQEAATFLGDRYEKLAGQAEELGKNVISTSDKIRVFGANTLGIIGGTLLFGGALTAAQGAVTGLISIFSPVIERMTGFTAKSAEVTKALAEQTDAQGGAADSAVAMAAAQANLSARAAAIVTPLLEERAAIEQGNKNLQEGIDLLHTYEEARRRGGDQGLFTTTGGFLGTKFFGVPSTQELIKKELNQGPNYGLNLPQAPIFGVGQPLGPSQEDAANNVKRVGTLVGGIAEDFDLLSSRIDFFNQQMRKGGETVRFMAGASEQAASAFAFAADTAQLTELGDVARGPNKVILVDEANNPIVDPERIRAATEAVNVGFQTPSAEQLIRPLLERHIPNQLAAFEAEANLQLQHLIPAQRGLEFLAAPPTPFGTGFTQVAQGTNGAAPFGAAPAGIGEFAGVDQNAIQSFNTYRTVAQSALDAVIAKAREGKQALLGLGVPPSLIAEMETLGNQAQGIEIGLANKQAAFQAAQYNHQLFILNRNLADARALLGQNVGAQGRLGALQRENFELGKKQHALQIQAQTLQLELTQRQINFQRAIAGFVAPGTTPEERAARIQQAKIEADFAQKQLDIQKQLLGLGKKQFVVGVQIFDESAKRQVQDLQFALAELKQARALQLDTQAAQQALAAIRARQAQINSEIGVAIEKATKKASLAINTALEIANKSGEAFSKILVQTATAWNIFVNQGASAVIKLLTGASGGGGGGGGGSAPKLLASGIVGDTLGPTNITVGEAGKEKVAVVKNPRNVSLQSLAGVAPSGGGGVVVIVDVHDNNVEKDTLDTLVAKVSTAVEETLNRKTSLFGLRRA